MAIDNIFLGLGRKSVGDVTLYRRAGKQCARVRVRNVRNPRSYKQLFTRAILSNVAQLYAAGIELFDHAFEGRSTGMENQRRFMKLNVDRLRARLTADYNSGAAPSACQARIGARNLKAPVPFPGLQVSEGNYSNTIYTYDAANYGFKLPLMVEGDTVSTYAKRAGLVPDDIYTFLCFRVTPWKDYMANYGPEAPNDHLQCIYPCFMFYAQIRVHDDILTDVSPLSAGDPLSKLFDYFGGEDISDYAFDDPVTQAVVFTDNSCGGIACIRSKWGTDFRSTSFLEQSSEDGWDFGITYHHLEDAWGDQAGINRADLILDGGNFQPGGATTNPDDFIGTLIPKIDSANVKAALLALQVGQVVTLVYNGWVLVFHRDEPDVLTMSYPLRSDPSTPSLKYDYLSNASYWVLLNWTDTPIADTWIEDLRSDMGFTSEQLVDGLPVNTFPKPSYCVEY